MILVDNTGISIGESIKLIKSTEGTPKFDPSIVWIPCSNLVNKVCVDLFDISAEETANSLISIPKSSNCSKNTLFRLLVFTDKTCDTWTPASA